MEYLDVLDSEGNIVGRASKEEVYSKKLPHRIVHVFVINPKTGEVYLQKRSESKDFLPGYWCTSAGGHVRAGESFEEAARRELLEELGLGTPLEKAFDTVYSFEGHARFIRVFTTKAYEGIAFADGEVSGGEFFSLEKASELISKNEKIHPQLAHCLPLLVELERQNFDARQGSPSTKSIKNNPANI